jgi:uncharacterized protein YxeA
MKKIIYIVLILVLASVGAVTAKSLIATDHTHNAAIYPTVIGHSGRTNKDGCHNDYKKGTYHCH